MHPTKDQTVNETQELISMNEITREKRKSSPYPSPSSPRKVEFEERNRISFHINSIQGLPSNQPVWQPNPSIFVSLINLEAKETHSTDPKKYANLVSWEENMPILEIRNTSKVRFEVRSQTLWKNKTTLGSTDAFQIADLLGMQNRVGNGREDFIELNIPFKTSQAILSLSVREMAMKDLNTLITAETRQRFMENCLKQSVNELRNFVSKMVKFRKMLNVDDMPIVCIIDIVLGVSEGVYEVMSNQVTGEINKNTVAFFQALSEAFTPYENLSSRHLSKKNEEYTTLLHDMLPAAVMAFESMINYLKMPYRYVGDKLEFKVTHWIHYFEECTRFLLVKETQKPSLRSLNKRTKCPSHMIANKNLPPCSLNVLAMDLPNTFPPGTYDRPDLLKLIAEWMFSPSSFEERENGKISSEKGKENQPTETNPVPPLDQGKERINTNLFCLSGPPGCGKTQLVSRATGWLAGMGCLGGYFSFDLDRTVTQASVPEDEKKNKQRSPVTKKLMPNEILNSLPVTFAHQLSIVEPDITDLLAENISMPSGAPLNTSTVEECFERLFGIPLRGFDYLRVQRRWNIPDPLLFIIDGIGCDDDSENSKIISELIKLLSSTAISRLPEHVKFLVICRSGSELGELLKENNVGYVYEMGSGSSPASSFCSGGSSASVSSGRTSNPKFSIQAF